MIQAAHGFRTKAATISTTAVAISAAGWSWTAGDLASADQAVVTAWSNGASLTWDGTTPTPTLGRALAAGETVVIVGNRNVQALQFIRSGAADAVVSVTLERFAA